MTGKQAEEEAFDQGILQAYNRLRQRDGSQFRSSYTEEQIAAAWKESGEPERKGCTAKRRDQIERECKDLKKLECQKCDTSEPKHPSTRPPVWSSAADLLFHKGLQEASEKARRECEKVLKLHQMAKCAGTVGNASVLGKLKSLRERFFFEFLARFCETFPECKNDLLRYDIAKGYRNGPAAWDDMVSALQKQPLCKPETLRFLHAYLEGDDPLWKLSLSECARRMGWFTEDNKPDHARVREILREYGIKHGMKGKPGRPKK